MNDPRNIHSHAHAMLVEQVMALHGRGSDNPRLYRRVLERMDLPALRRAIEESDFPDGQSGTDFPAPSLTENAGVIASADTGHAPGSARDFSVTRPTPLVTST